MSINASCSCGQLTITAREAPVYSCYCHCNACQARSSAPCMGFVMVKQDACSVSGEEKTFKDQGGSGQPIVQHFCTGCGGSVFSELKVLNNILAIPSARLQNPDDFQPESHIWVSSKDLRFEIQDDLLQQPGPPLSLLEFVATPA
jgi:hypothetical protein